MAWSCSSAEFGKVHHYLDICNARSVIEGERERHACFRLRAPNLDDDVVSLGSLT